MPSMLSSPLPLLLLALLALTALQSTPAAAKPFPRNREVKPYRDVYFEQLQQGPLAVVHNDPHQITKEAYEALTASKQQQHFGSTLDKILKKLPKADTNTSKDKKVAVLSSLDTAYEGMANKVGAGENHIKASPPNSTGATGGVKLADTESPKAPAKAQRYKGSVQRLKNQVAPPPVVKAAPNADLYEKYLAAKKEEEADSEWMTDDVADMLVDF